jgi:hypothetical protein
MKRSTKKLLETGAAAGAGYLVAPAAVKLVDKTFNPANDTKARLIGAGVSGLLAWWLL